jgi:hypothetical protein
MVSADPRNPQIIDSIIFDRTDRSVRLKSFMRNQTILYDNENFIVRNIELTDMPFNYVNEREVTDTGIVQFQRSIRHNKWEFTGADVDPAETDTTYFEYDHLGRVTKHRFDSWQFVSFDYSGKSDLLTKLTVVKNGKVTAYSNFHYKDSRLYRIENFSDWERSIDYFTSGVLDSTEFGDHVLRYQYTYY